MLLDLPADRHSVRFVPLDGAAALRTLPLGVRLDDPWCEIATLPASPPPPPCSGIGSRNDYPLGALRRQGVHEVELPLDGLRDPIARRRLAPPALQRRRPTVFGSGLPDAPTRALLADAVDAIEALEVVVDLAELAQASAPCPGLPAPLKTQRAGMTAHCGASAAVSWGFGPKEIEPARAILARPGIAAAFGDCAVEIGPHQTLPGAELAALTRELGSRVDVTVSFRPPRSDDALDDDEAILLLRETSLAAAHTHPEPSVLIDTFIDADRGYFSRLGPVDRRCNPRPAGRMLIQRGRGHPG